MAASQCIRDRILVVDDDEQIRDMLSRFLGEHGYAVSVAANGDQMLAQIHLCQTDLVLLDLNLPGGMDGLDLARELRAKSDIPIMMLTERNDVIDRIVGIEIGADDYLPKPFHLREVHARIKAILRRRARTPKQLEPDDEIVLFHGWTLDMSRRQLSSDQRGSVELSTGDFDMLATLVRHPGRVLSREFLLEQTRPGRLETFDRCIDTQIARLRKKLEIDSRRPELIKSVRGIGYLFAAPVSHGEGTPEARRS